VKGGNTADEREPVYFEQYNRIGRVVVSRHRLGSDDKVPPVSIQYSGSPPLTEKSISAWHFPLDISEVSVRVVCTYNSDCKRAVA